MKTRSRKSQPKKPRVKPLKAEVCWLKLEKQWRLRIPVVRVFKIALGGEAAKIFGPEDFLFPTKAEAIKMASQIGRENARIGAPTSIRFRRKDGKWQKDGERSFGFNRPNSKG